MRFDPISGTFDPAVERQLQALAVTVEHGRGFQLVVLEGPPAGRAEVRLRLERWPGFHAVATPEGLEHELATGSTARRVLWVEAGQPDQLGSWLAYLRRQRDRLQREQAGCIVLASSVGLVARVLADAPDLASILEAPIQVGEPRSHPPQGRPLTWLHISDLHVQSVNWRADVVLEQLVRDLPGLLDHAGLKPDLLFCTGDIANRGKSVEYTAAREALTALLAAVRLEPRSALYVVPGNHDVDRAAIDRTGRALQRTCVWDHHADIQEFNEILGAPQDLGVLGRRLLGYCQFTQDLLGPARAVAPDQPWREDEWSADGLKVGIASLCSVLVSGADGEHGRLLLGERQVRDAAEKLRHCAVRIALLHHPTSWLNEAEQIAVDECLQAEFHFVLHGHLHASRTQAVLAAGGTSVVSAAGATYANDMGRPYQVQAVQFDPATGEVAIRSFVWTPRHGGHWHADHGHAPATRDGVQRLSLPALALVTRPGAGVAGLVERLARTAVRIAESFDFVGINVPANRPRARLTDIFVPQAFLPFTPVAPRDTDPAAREQLLLDIARDRHGLTTDLDALLATLLNPGEHAARVAVLGGPGLGKSTLCKYVALRAAEAGLVPLHIRLRDYVREGGGGMGAFLVRQYGQDGIALDEPQLDGIAAAGKAVLIVDGFDEVGAEADRTQIRNQVVGLADRWPLVPVLCTSRVVGYDRAPLPEHFRHLQLAPFTPEQVRDFIGRWYELAVPNDPRERQRRMADLLGALARTPAAQELASIPLLATLIALVHRYSARLPGSRTRLLEQVVETLLDTWPAENRRQFRGISVDQQRRLLEGLAWHGLGARQDGSTAVTVDLDTAVRVCTDRLAPPTAPDRADKERLVRAWLAWMVAGTGLLIEASPGVLEFLHLSIGEYLAAQAWLASESAAGATRVAEGLVALALRPVQYQLALYAAATACLRFEGMQGELVAAMGRRKEARNGWVWLLDLVQEGAIQDQAAICTVVERVLGADTTRQWSLMSATEIFDAIIAHDLPGRPTVEQACLAFVSAGAVDYLMVLTIGREGELARRCGEVLATRRDHLGQALEMFLWADWSVPALRLHDSSEILSTAVANFSVGIGFGPWAMDTLVRVPAAGLPLCLGAIAGSQQHALKAAAGVGCLEVEGPVGRLLVVPPAPAGLLVRDPALEFRALSPDYAWTFSFGVGRTETAGSNRTDFSGAGDGTPTANYAWRRDANSGSPTAASTLASLPGGWPPAFWIGLAQVAALERSHGTVSGGPRPSEDKHYPWGTALWCLATTNLWHTPDGLEPDPDTLDLSTWTARYFWHLCRWVASPADPERAQAVAVQIATCPAEYRGLAAELSRWRVVPHGTPEYEQARKRMLARPRNRGKKR